MKIPKKLKIGGHNYKVIVREIEKGYGYKDSTSGEIVLNDKLIQSEKEVTLFHEILHVINPMWKEETIENISQGMYQVLSDNNLLK